MDRLKINAEAGNLEEQTLLSSSPDIKRGRRMPILFIGILIILFMLTIFSFMYLDLNWITLKSNFDSRSYTIPRIKAYHFYEKKTVKKTDNSTKLANISTGRFRTDPLLPFSDLYTSMEGKPLQSTQLVIAVFTAPCKFVRREAIRETWWKACASSTNVTCTFFTDSLDSVKDDSVRNKIIEESKVHQDMVFMPIGSGILFGHRLLYVLQWATSRFEFDHFMRLDDDFMLCLDHLMWDLKNIPKKLFHWGFLHCGTDGLVYIDEGITMFSKDLVLAMLSQKADRMLCHPYGDQTYTIWLQDIGVDRHTVEHPGNNRIHHDPPAERDPKFKTMQNICDHYLALHGVYNVATMKDYYQRRGNGENYSKFPGTPNFCSRKLIMLWRLFGGMYHAVPKLCRDPADWPQGKISVYPGRE